MVEAQKLETLKLDVVTPTRALFSKKVSMVVVPGSEGDFGVLYNHAPLVSTLKTGIVEIYEGANVTKRIFVSGGFSEVNGTSCAVLAEGAHDLADVKRSDAEERLEKAKKNAGKAASEFERTAAEKQVAIAEALLEAVK